MESYSIFAGAIKTNKQTNKKKTRKSQGLEAFNTAEWFFFGGGGGGGEGGGRGRMKAISQIPITIERHSRYLTPSEFYPLSVYSFLNIFAIKSPL